MAITKTATYTAAFARTELIKLQLERVLGRSTGDADYSRRLLVGIDNKWIGEISVYGMDVDGYCQAELFVKIDWVRNALHMSAGRDTVEVDAGWEGGIATEVDLALQKFEKLARELGLHKVVRFRYAPGIDGAAANRALRFKFADEVRWRSGHFGTAMGIPELDEMTVGINIAGED